MPHDTTTSLTFHSTSGIYHEEGEEGEANPREGFWRGQVRIPPGETKRVGDERREVERLDPWRRRTWILNFNAPANVAAVLNLSLGTLDLSTGQIFFGSSNRGYLSR
ncbi:hypothetical protein SUGI_1006670 [Cryptomeria japonica]|nr:hypothetical protein SUGI_1006670 [Cryptomeria japonica]